MEREHFESLYPDTARYEEIEKVLSFIKEGNSCQILGVPGCGRSTLLGLLAFNKGVREKHLGKDADLKHFVVVNFSEIRNRPLFDAMKFLFLNLADSLRERNMTEEYQVVNTLFRDNLSFNDELVLFQGLKEAVDYLALERKLGIIFLFDRFEEYIPAVTNDFFTNLRTLRNRTKFQFSIIFSLNRPLEAIIEPVLLSDFYEIVAGRHVYITPFDEPSTEFRIKHLEQITGKKVPSPTLQKLATLSGKFGRLIRLEAEAYLAHDRQELDLEQFFLTQKPIVGALMEIWLWLSPAEQSDLLTGEYEDALVEEYLVRVGLIQKKKIRIPIFDTFIHTHLDRPQTNGKSIYYDQNTNAIKKGEIVLSDQLTSSEFRLLRYLLQHPDALIERDELIRIVWQNVKSTAGITDQAIDQLIFRLRHKIEEDPNNPTQLLTVKGRGFKFVK